LRIQQAITDNNPKGNANTERGMCTCKEEGLWLKESTCLFALVRALDLRITNDNEHYLHLAQSYKMPSQFERQYQTAIAIPFVTP
jgi:hypothetical protein